MKPLSRPKNWPAASVEMWAIDRLKAYARNARTHSAEQVAQIAASMREWGFTVPILAQPDGTIIAAEMTGRRCMAIELNPVYVDMAIQRWQAFAGGEARLEASGKTYDETMHERYDANADGLGSYEVWMAEKRKTLAAAE